MADFGVVSSRGLSSNQLKLLKDALKTQVTDFSVATDRINSAIKAAASSSGSTGSVGSTATTASTVLTSPIFAMLGALYDRYNGEAFRLGKDTIEKFGDVLTLNLNTMRKKMVDFFKSELPKMMEEMNEIDDKIIKVVNANAMFVGQVATSMREEIRDVLPLAQMMGVSTEDFLAGAESLFKAQGRMVTYSQETLSQAVKVGKAYTESSTDIMTNVDNFRNVGIGLADASRDIERIGKSSVGLGLNAKETTKTVMSNLDKMNQYGFKNGIDGLAKMVMQSQALKINMDNVFKIADKVFDPEGAIELTAGLQSIGGAFGDLADPMRAMYDATNNVEGLQDAFIQAASSLAVYNEEQGRFMVGGADLRRAKAMADLYGISLNEVTNAATKGKAKLEAMSQLQMFSNLTQQQQEFVSNMSQMKEGKLGIEVPKSMMDELGLKESFVELGNLTSGQIEKIKKMQEDMVSMSTEEIAYEQMNTTTNILNTLTSIKLGLENSIFRSTGSQIGREAMKYTSESLRKYGPGKEKDILKSGEELLKEVMDSKYLPKETIDLMKLGIENLRQNLEIKPTNRKIPDDMLVPNDIYRGTSRATAPVKGRYDVYFHASSNLVTPFLTAMERDSQLRKNFSDALQNPSYLSEPEVMA